MRRDRIGMSCSRKFFWTAIIFAVLSLRPVPGHAVEIDPYSFRSLEGSISFEYEKTTREDTGFESEASNFQQIYSLDTRGNLISRRLIIYDAGVEYTDTDYRFGDTTTASTSLMYYLSTTLLSKSAIPLTLFGDRTQSNASNGVDRSDTTTTYGFSWQSLIRRLPHVYAMAQRTVQEGDSADVDRLLYRLNIDKDIGPTQNEAKFYGTRIDNKRSGTTDLRNTLLLRNRTDIAKNTRLTANAIATSTEFDEAATTAGDPQTDAKSYGLNILFVSKPSKEFDQMHSYSFFNYRQGDDKFDGDSYSGDLSYRFSERMTGDMNLSIARDNDSTSTTSNDSKTIRTSANLEYHLTTNLRLQERVSYNLYETTASTADGINLTDRATLEVKTTVLYRRRLSWASFFANFGLGYIDDDSVLLSEFSGKGLTIEIGTGLSGVNIVPYLVFGASAYERRVKQLTGSIHGRTRRYELTASNKFWERFIKMSASFNKSSEMSWISTLETKEETYKFDASSDYLTNTRLRFDAERAHYFNTITGFNSYNIMNFIASHSRFLYGGRLTLIFRYNFRDINNENASYISRELNYEARYRRPLLRRVLWEASVSRTERKTDGFAIDSSKVKNSFIYQLRAWALSANHIYTKDISETRDVTDNTIMLTATRQFYRTY